MQELKTERIVDPDDPRVAPFRDIRERDLVGRQGRFLAEGKVVLNVLFEARRFMVESALFLESRIEGMRDTLAKIPEGTPIYTASPEVMDRISGFHMHRGILAIGLKRPPQNIDELLATLPERALVVVMIGISNHDNVGAIFRNAAAFAANAVLLDASSCDPLYRKAIRVSVGATLKVPYAVAESVDELLASLDAAGFTILALSPAGEKDIRQVAPSNRAALMLGSEGEGLPVRLLERTRTVRIPMASDFDSLNVGTASGIALHEIWDG